MCIVINTSHEVAILASSPQPFRDILLSWSEVFGLFQIIANHLPGSLHLSVQVCLMLSLFYAIKFVQRTRRKASSLGLVFKYKCAKSFLFQTETHSAQNNWRLPWRLGSLRLFVCVTANSFTLTVIRGAGIELAGLADLPQAVIVEGQRVANRLSDLQAKREEESRSGKIALRRKALLRVTSSVLKVLSLLTITLYSSFGRNSTKLLTIQICQRKTCLHILQSFSMIWLSFWVKCWRTQNKWKSPGQCYDVSTLSWHRWTILDSKSATLAGNRMYTCYRYLLAKWVEDIIIGTKSTSLVITSQYIHSIYIYTYLVMHVHVS